MHVYALGDPRTQQIHYIGIAENVFKRYAQHLNTPHKNEKKNAWMAEVKQSGLVPTLAILESGIEEAVIYEREKYWIQYHTALNAPLTNVMHNTKNVKRALAETEQNFCRLEQKEQYHIQELFDCLPLTIEQLSSESDISEAGLVRMRDGKRTMRYRINKLLIVLSRIYDRELSIHNVIGFDATNH